MNVYIAGAFARRAEIDHYRRDLERAGLTVVSTWHRDPRDTTPEHELTHAQRQTLAQRDLDDLDQADVMVLVGDPPSEYGGAGGKFVELGYALAWGIPVVVVAHRESVYGCLPEITYCESWPTALAYLGTLRRRGNGRRAA